MRSLMICTSHPGLFRGGQIEIEMGGKCSTFGGEERFIQDFGGGDMKERDYLDGPGVDGMKLL
jgi:hypothetical protein